MDLVDKVRKFLKKINISGRIAAEEPMSRHTTFEVGGPADIYAEPADFREAAHLLREASRMGLPVFVLGGGANILVSDRGIRGLVMSTVRMAEVRAEGEVLTAGAGAPVSAVAEAAAEAGLGGLDFIYAMPGSVGGALWMNARCYDSSIADVLESVRYLDGALEPRRAGAEDPDFMAGFDYKKSPFQRGDMVILEASFRLRRTDPETLWKRMREIREDRTAKGHFLAPSAGSVFKNNRDFGAPSGVIIDRLGLRGLSVGPARVSPLHANIILNTGGATARDIRSLIHAVQDRVFAARGFRLEPETLFVGDWDGEEFL